MARIGSLRMGETPEVWLLRHCEAEPARGPGGDSARTLNLRGEEDAEEIGRALAERGLRVARVLSSPLPRARETASRAAAAGLAPGVAVEEDPRLAPGGDTKALAEEAAAAGPWPVLLVGHNPDLEVLTFDLCGQGVRYRKGTLVRISLARGTGRLLEIFDRAG